MPPRWVVFTLVAVVAGCAVTTGPCSSCTDQGRLEGKWGGTDASLDITRAGGRVTYACGHGTVDSAWTLDTDGAFRGVGQHYFGGGPVPEGGRPPQSARYEGILRGAELEWRVRVEGHENPLGPFRLLRGGPPVTERCL